jgi:hypothetical protein
MKRLSTVLFRRSSAVLSMTKLQRRSQSSFPFSSGEAEQVASQGLAGPAAATSLARSTILPPTDFPESSFLKCIQKEMDDEELRLDKECPPIPQGWEVAHDEGTSYWTMRRKWVAPATGINETHDLRVQLTTRDPSLDPECDIRGEHIPFSIVVTSDANELAVDLSCDVVEGELVVDNIRSYESKRLAQDPSFAASVDRSTLYPGPNFDEAEEDLLDGIQAWLAERQFDDQFGEFVGHYSVWIEQMEYERWLKMLKSFVAA